MWTIIGTLNAGRWSNSRQNWASFQIAVFLAVLFLLGMPFFILKPPPIENYQQNENNKSTSEPWTDNSLLNIRNFTWLLNNENLCKQNRIKTNITINDYLPKHLMPIIIHSARSHFVERLAIRMSWGSLASFKNWDIRLIFLFGETPEINKDENDRLLEEFEMFGDLVVGKFVDSYKNLTYKHLMGYKWILNFCENAKMVTKIDDDIFLDILQWITMINTSFELVPNSYGENNVPQIYCKLWKDARPYRNPKNKWFISYKEWPYLHYPHFCSGRAYAIKADLLKKMYLLSHSEKTFNRMDDVFITGHLLQLVMDKYKEETLWFGDISKVCNKYPQTYRETCNRNEHSNGKVVTLVERGKYFMETMKCMWDNTVVDYFSMRSNIETEFVPVQELKAWVNNFVI